MGDNGYKNYQYYLRAIPNLYSFKGWAFFSNFDIIIIQTQSQEVFLMCVN
jgi:hypothetical protein